jgi:hypothetical protein
MAAAGPGGDQPGGGPFADQVAFELGRVGEHMEDKLAAGVVLARSSMWAAGQDDPHWQGGGLLRASGARVTGLLPLVLHPRQREVLEGEGVGSRAVRSVSTGSAVAPALGLAVGACAARAGGRTSRRR